MHRFGRRRMRVGNNHRRAFHCDAEEKLGKFQRQPDAPMRVGVTWEIAGMQRDPAPSHALHVRHLRALVDTRGMMNFLFQNCENPGRSWMPGSPRTDTRSRDADTVSIYI